MALGGTPSQYASILFPAGLNDVIFSKFVTFVAINIL